MSVRIYNTLKRDFEDFNPLKEGEVKVYICGLTVYSGMHIGHARTYIAFDAILRYLKHRGYSISYIQNITDVDDKIINKSKELGVTPTELSEKYSKQMLEDQRALNLVKADQYPKVTSTIDDIITAIKELIDNGYAYTAQDGVYFEVAKSGDYGKLSNQDTDQLTGTRLPPSSVKKSKLDFGLWKQVEKEEYGFESPWGYGRPGWHIECSVMSRKHLGEQIDIHGGALDLIFPHHENEIAQSEALSGKKPFVKYWMHTGFLNSTGEKMSKSLGNIISVRDLLKDTSADVFRLFVLQTHYRSPIDYSPKSLADAEKAYGKIKNYLEKVRTLKTRKEYGAVDASGDVAEFEKGFAKSMDDDFNTPKALAHLFDYIRKFNATSQQGLLDERTVTVSEKAVKTSLAILGIKVEEGEIPTSVKELVVEREDARKEKDYERSDEIRDEVAGLGYALKDNPDGTTTVSKL